MRISTPTLAVLLTLALGTIASSSPTSALTTDEQRTINACDRISTSVVLILCRTIDPETGAENLSAGSGFAIDDQHIITDYHVIENAIEINIVTHDEEPHPVSVVGTAPYFDIALLKYSAPTPPLPPAPLASGTPLKVGQQVFAIGSPFGTDISVTSGIISGLDREFSFDDVKRQLIQFDASVNPGQSGGPLINSDGEVVGVIIAKVQDGEAIGFATPIDRVMATLPDLIEMGHPFHPEIGIQGIDVSNELAALFDLEVPSGFLVEEVEPNSAAADAGLKRGHRIVEMGDRVHILGGDIILAANDTPITGGMDLARFFFTLRPGATVNFTIWRNGDTHKIRLEIPPMSHWAEE